MKYSKFTDNIASGNFTEAFCQKTNKFFKKWMGFTPLLHLHTHTPLVMTLVTDNEVKEKTLMENPVPSNIKGTTVCFIQLHKITFV